MRMVSRVGEGGGGRGEELGGGLGERVYTHN